VRREARCEAGGVGVGMSVDRVVVVLIGGSGLCTFGGRGVGERLVVGAVVVEGPAMLLLAWFSFSFVGVE
jgi:hypothetical protein